MKIPVLHFPVIVFLLWVSTLSLGREVRRSALSLIAARLSIIALIYWRLRELDVPSISLAFIPTLTWWLRRGAFRQNS